MVGFSSHNGDDSSDGIACEIAEEARPIEMLKLSEGITRAHALQTEYAMLCRNPVDGIYVIPSACDPSVWFGILFVRRGEYGGAILRFTVLIPPDFPDTVIVPTIRFDLDVFNPNVYSRTHEVDMSRNFPDGWKKDRHHIVQTLLVVQRIFFSLDVAVETAANPEAALLYKEQKDKYREMVSNCVNNSRSHIYDDPLKAEDPNALRVTPWDSSIHEPLRDRMMLLGSGRSTESSAWSERGKRAGYSWVDTERMTYMTEPLTHHKVDDSVEKAAADRATHGIERLDLSGVNGEEEESAENESVERIEHAEEEKQTTEEKKGDKPETPTNGHTKLHRVDGIETEEEREI